MKSRILTNRLLLLSFSVAFSAVATTRTVTNNSDSGPGSLRDTIAASAPGDTIDFASGLTGSILAGLKLSRTNEEDARAEEGLRSAIARIEGTAFGDVFAAFNSDPDDDPALAPGAGFAVESLTAVAGDPDGLVGEVIFPTVDNGGKLELREDVADPAFQMPRDLSGDGGWDNENHADDYVILPVRVRVRWSGASGERVRERSVLLVE